MQGIAPEALKSILHEYIEELDEREAHELQSAEQVTIELHAFISERMPADDSAEDE